MKKFLFVVLAVMLLTFSAVFAQETETVNEVNWTDIEPAVAESGISGDFYAVSDLGIQKWIHSVFNELELDEEDVEDGFICILETEDEEEGVMAFYSDFEGAGLEDLLAFLIEEEGVAEPEMGVINGIPAVT